MVKTAKSTAATTTTTAPTAATTAEEVKPTKVARRRKPNTSSYASYIYKVLKGINPNVGISGKTLRVMDSFCEDMFQKICIEAGRIARYNKKHTISVKTVKSACQIVLPGQIQVHAISEGTKAVNKFVLAETQ